MLTLRPIMMDAFLVIELLESANKCSQDNNFQPLVQKCIEFLSDGINSSKAYLERLKKVEISLDIDEVYNSMLEEIKELHEANSVNFSKSKNIQIRQILGTSKSYETYHKHFDVYYTVFSKVEHFGFIYNRWVIYPLEKKEDSINKSIKLLMLHFWNLISLLFISNFEHDFVIQRIEFFKQYSKVA